MNPKQLLITMLLLLAVIISAEVPQMINYQAQLLDPSTDQPIADNTYQITFKIYDTEAATTAIWTEMHSVQTQAGMYNVLLGSQYPVTNEILTGSEKWLGVKVGTDNEMLPRKRFTSVAYALADNDFKFDGDDIYFNTGNVGIGVSDPDEKLEVNGKIVAEEVTSEAGFFQNRGDPEDFDFTTNDFTTNEQWYELDCSLIVPENAKAILLYVQIKSDNYSDYLTFRKNGNINNFVRSTVRTQVPNVFNDLNCIVSCDNDRMIEYKAKNTSFSEIYVSIMGWWK
jgi:hypothetical protein